MKRLLVSISLFLLFHGKSFGEPKVCHEQGLGSSRLRYVSIAFAGQDLRSPVSMFGHTFLVFHQDEIPEPDAPAFEFLGKTEGQSYMPLKAIAGTLPGKFAWSCFHQKRTEYDQEDRDIWIYRLRLSPNERDRLQSEVERAEGRPTTYGFLNQNCSSQIYSTIMKSLNQKEGLFLVHLPIAGMRHLSSIGVLEDRPVLIRSSYGRLMDAYRTLSPTERHDFESALGMNWQPNPDPKIQRVMSRYVNYRLRKEESPIRRRELFYTKKFNEDSSINEIEPSDPAREDQRANLLLSYFRPIGLWELAYLPGIQSFWGLGKGANWESGLELGKIELSLRRSSFLFQRFRLFGLDAFSGEQVFRDSFVRYVDLGYSNWGNWLDSNATKVEGRIGSGLAFRPVERLNVVAIAYLGVGRYLRMDDSSLGGVLGVRGRASIRLARSWGIQFTVDRNVLGRQSIFDLMEAEMVAGLKNGFSLGLRCLSFREQDPYLGAAVSWTL